MVIYPHLGENGRLGNQLFQIAATFGLAHHFGWKASFDPWSYQEAFSVPKEFFTSEPGVPALVLAPHIPKRHRLYLQDFRLFEEIQDQIRAYLSPSEEMMSRMRARHPAFFRGTDKTSIHIRRTDFVELTNAYLPLSLDYFLTGIALIRKEFPATKFFVFSDDINWCREALGGGFEYISEAYVTEIGSNGIPLGNKTDAEDLLMMAQCDHHICSNSTYSWWGAYLSKDRRPIVPKDWFGPELSDIDMNNFLPESWLKLDWQRDLKVFAGPHSNLTEVPSLAGLI